MSVATFTKTGTKATTAAKLPTSVFGVEVANHELLKLAYSAYLANGRLNLAKTKTRGLVRGGGKKPWKQKGTGRARFGSSRNPIWRGGGIAFGPTGEENYKISINLTAKRQALRQALTLAAKDGHVKIIENFEVKDAKVATSAKLLGKIEVTGTVLLVLASKDEATVRATRNLENVKVVSANYLNVYDIMNADNLVITEDALKVISEWLGGKK